MCEKVTAKGRQTEEKITPTSVQPPPYELMSQYTSNAGSDAMGLMV